MKFAIILLIFINSGLLIAQKGKWQQFPTDFDNDLHGIYFTDSLTGYICGENGLILKTTDGKNWLPQETPTTNTLYDLHFIRDTLGWACGDNGIIIHTVNGGSFWEIQPTNCNRQLVSIEFFDYQTGFTGYSVGDSILAVKYYNEPSWLFGNPDCNYHFVTYQHPTIHNTLFMCNNEMLSTSDNGMIWVWLWYFDEDQLDIAKRLDLNLGEWDVNFWLVGKNGSAYSFDQPIFGWPFYSSVTPDTLDLFGVAVDEYAHNVWAVGEMGRILFSDDEGETYNLTESPVSFSLNDIYFSGFETGYIVGNNGTIIYYNEEWIVSNSGEKSEVKASVYPNPFKDNTTIKLYWNNDKPFIIGIFDLQGKLVKNFKNEISADIKEIFWDGTNSFGNKIDKGIYILRIKTAKQSKSIKLIKL